MPSVKDILIEMKDMSELMVDLAYSAVLFNNKDAAEEVLTLENRLNSHFLKLQKPQNQWEMRQKTWLI